MIDLDALKQSIEHTIKAHKEPVLELGCGPNKRHPHSIGIDAIAYDNVDIVADINTVLPLFPDSSVSEVHSYHCLEHINNLDFIINQLGRILKSNGILHVVVPHFSNPYFYSDPTHRRFFGLYSFAYYAETYLFKRSIPNYSLPHFFNLFKVKLIFKSPKPFYLRWLFKKAFEKVFNITYSFMEFYEENLCYIVPCYEIEYWLTRNERPTV